MAAIGSDCSVVPYFMEVAAQKQVPTVCALVPAYNPGVFLRIAIQSLLDQTRRPDRIIVIDDASTDGSTATIQDWISAGVVELVRNEINQGKARSLNQAFREIDSDYFLFQDSDDVSLPTRVERQVAFMESRPTLGCSSSFIEYINSSGKSFGVGKLDLTDEERLAEYLSGDEPFALFCPAAIVRGVVVKDSNLQFRSFWPGEDMDLWNRIAEAGWLALAQPEVLVQYRIHGGSAVGSNYMRMRVQLEWLKSCLRARRSGREEPSYEDFYRSWQQVGFPTRINRFRKNFAKGQYRAGGFALAEGRRLEAALRFGSSLVLAPTYASRRLLQQLHRKTGEAKP